MTRTLAIAALLLAACGSLPGEVPWRTARVSLEAPEQRPVSQLIRELAVSQNMQAVISPQVKSMVSGSFQSVPTGALLDTLCEAGNCTWFYDGGKLHVDSQDETLTRTVAVTVLDRKSLEEAMTSVGFASGPPTSLSSVKGGSQAGLLLLVGGPRYLQAAELVARELDVQMAERLVQAGQEYVVRTYRLKYATAQDSTVSAGSGASATIPGVATTLQNLMGTQLSASLVNGPVYTDRLRSRDGLRGTGLGAIGRQGTADSQPAGRRGEENQEPLSSNRPIIVVDTRLNAIVVRDLAAKMPLYDELIAMLDVPTQAIEITAAIVDVDATNGKDLGVEFLGNYTAKDGNVYRFGFDADRDEFSGNSPPQDAVAGFLDGANLARGGGLNATALIGGQGFDLLTRLRALEEKGGADIVSSPSVLTMENIEAIIRTEETFYVRVAGEQEVDLFDVKAGVQLRVTPTIVQEGAQRSFRLQLDVTDGSFQDSTVDGVPGTRESAITTQAVVPESKTLLVGGYFIERTVNNTRQVPFLGNIPILGNAFKRKETLKERKQRFFFITPRMVQLHRDTTPAIRDDAHPATKRAREMANDAWQASNPNPEALVSPVPGPDSEKGEVSLLPPLPPEDAPPPPPAPPSGPRIILKSKK